MNCYLRRYGHVHFTIWHWFSMEIIFIIFFEEVAPLLTHEHDKRVVSRFWFCYQQSNLELLINEWRRLNKFFVTQNWRLFMYLLLFSFWKHFFFLKIYSTYRVSITKYISRSKKWNNNNTKTWIYHVNRCHSGRPLLLWLPNDFIYLNDREIFF